MKPKALRRFEREIDFLRRRLSPEGAFGLHLTLGLLIMLVGFWCFAEIAEDLKPGAAIAFQDEQVTNWCHAHASPQITRAARIGTTFGSIGFLSVASAICALALLRARAWDRLLALACTMIGGSLLNIALKHFFQRQRPVLENPLVTLTSYGFPSGHAMGATLLYGLLALFAVSSFRSGAKRVLAAVFAVVLILMIGLTRIYLGAHYLTDVLGAFAAGAVWLAFSWTAAETLRKRRHRPSAAGR
ncbi:MAG TPA: phosphatase PAP2 family protein [Chthoniobacterales bacterium]|nr:phosphatase PAP2 family protein [Chthoniobacterales bacterium]